MKRNLMVALVAVSLLGLSGVSASASVVRPDFDRPQLGFNRPFVRPFFNPFFARPAFFHNPFFFKPVVFNPFFVSPFVVSPFAPFVDVDFD